MTIDCISDLHGHYPKLEGGDLLIVAGDLTAHHEEEEYDDFWRWLCYQDYKHKVVVAGNHDVFLESNPDFLKDCGEDIHYLSDSGIELDGFKIWGSPWIKWFFGINPNCAAFTCVSEDEIKEKWDIIPRDTNILITHMPPFTILDKTSRGGHVGSSSLNSCVLSGNYFSDLDLHVFGHIHENGGKIFETPIRKFVNASIMNEVYDPVNKPVRVVL